jgi:hypothetical protein
MTAPRKLYGMTLKPRTKAPPRKVIDVLATVGRPDVLEAVRRVLAEHRGVVERPS